MKKHLFAVFFAAMCCSFFTSSTFGQITSFSLSQGLIYPFDYGSRYNALIISGYLSNIDPLTAMVIPETGGIITIDWGDGQTQTFTITNNVYDFQDDYLHLYANPGIYTVNVTIFSQTSGAYVDGGQSFTWWAHETSSCGGFRAHVWYNYQEDQWFPGLPLDFTDVNGITTTITAYDYYWTVGAIYVGLDLDNGPYTYRVNPDWLLNNGMEQLFPSGDSVLTLYPMGIPDPMDANIYLVCGGNPANPDFTFDYAFGTAFVAPLQTGGISFKLSNLACNNTANASITLNFPPGFIPDTTNLNNAVAGIGNVAVNDTSLTFDVLNVNTYNHYPFFLPFTFPGATPEGTVVPFSVTVSNSNDTDTTNNRQDFTAIVLNSYDPNSKEVNQPTDLYQNVQEELTYTIHFQNDGNLNTYKVVVKDTIDANLDLSTLQLVDSKYPVIMSTDPATRVVTFSFNDCRLAPSANNLDSSQCYVVYKIRENAGLPMGSTIENTAYIYFDFNPAIVTNTTYNINQVLGLAEQQQLTVSLFPNPTGEKVRFSGAHVEAVRIFDASGKLLLNTKVNDNELSVAHFASGIYQLIIEATEGVTKQKLTICK